MTGSRVAAGLVGARILALLTLMGGAWLLGSASVDVPAVAVGPADQDWILIWSDRDSPVSVTWTSRPDGTVSLSRVPFKAADGTLPGDEGSVVVELHGRSRISVTKADPGVAVESGPSDTDPQVVRIPALAGEPILEVTGRPRQAWSDEGAGRREVRSPWLTLGAAAAATDGRVPPDETSRLSVGIVEATDENLDDYSPQSAHNESVTVSDYTLLEHGPRVYWSTI